MLSALVVPVLCRHTTAASCDLRCATLNIRSLTNKVNDVEMLWRECQLDLMCLTETWHEDADDVPLRRLRAGDLQVVEQAHPVLPKAKVDDTHFQNYGGVALIASSAVRLTVLTPPLQSNTFELLCVRIVVGGKACIVAIVYRPGSEKVPASFPDELGVLLECMSSFSMPIAITGDMNVKFDRPDDPMTHRINELLSTYGATQMINDVTHKRGGILDVVIARDEDVSTVEVADQPGDICDHKLLSWKFQVAETEPKIYKTHSRRKWKTFALEAFKSNHRSSSLCDALGQDDVMTCPRKSSIL